MGWQNAVRIAVQLMGIIALVAAVILAGVGLCTPAWREQFSRQLHQEKQKGLWQTCARGAHQTVEGSSHTWVCDYKDFGAHGTDPFEEWQNTVLILIGVGTALGLFALIFSLVASCVRWCAYVWVFTTFIACAMNISGVVYFAVRSHDHESRYELAGTETTELQLGWSYWSAVWACGAFVAAVLLSIITLLLVIAVARLADHPNTSYSRITTQQATKTAKGGSTLI